MGTQCSRPWVEGVTRGAPEDEQVKMDRHACRPDLRSHSQLRALFGVYAVRGLEGEVVKDFVAGVDQDVDADRFDLADLCGKVSEGF